MTLRFFSVLTGIMASAVIIAISPGWCGAPYSANGIGIVIPDNGVISSGMGGAGIANDDGKNFLRDNPAMLAGFTAHTLSFGVEYNWNTMNTDEAGNLTYAKLISNQIKIVLPVMKGIVFGWGLSPYSRSEVVINIPDPEERFTDKMTSTGGINISSVALAGSYRDIIRFGYALNYNFGMIQEDWTRKFTNSDEFGGMTNYIKKKYKGYSSTVSILVHLFDKMSVGIGYTSKADIEMNVLIRPKDISNKEHTFPKENVSLPARWCFGITSELSRRLSASMDLSYVLWEDAAVFPKEKEMYNDTYSFGAGMRLKPPLGLNLPFYQKIPVSAGFRFATIYYKSYPVVDTISEKAVTLGIEFPFMENNGSLISSFEYGIRGDKSINGWDETFMNVRFFFVGAIK